MNKQTRPLADFMPLLMPNAPACPWPVAEQALRLSAAEFCERTRCWRHMTERRIRRRESCIVAPEYSAIHEIESASFDGERLAPIQFSDIDPGEDDDATTGPPRWIAQAGPNSVIVIPVAEGRLTLSMFLKPRVGADGVTRDTYDGDSDEPANNVPEFLFVQHAEAIVAGALNRVLNLPGQVFSNPARAAQYLMAFERNVDTHFALNVRGQHRAPARVRAQYI